MPPVTPGGLILVTGANGYLAGVTIQKFLDAGFSVRGTVRNASKNEWMNSHYGPKFSLVEVPDVNTDNALTEAIKGVNGVAYVAANLEWDVDPQKTVVPAIKGVIGLLEAAAKEESVQSVVYTSSQGACITLEPGKEYHITKDTWNEPAKAAWDLPLEGGMPRMTINYLCSKVEAEQRAFKWVEEHKPRFTFNTVVPNYILGTLTSPQHTGFGSSAGLVKMLWDGNPMGQGIIPSQWFVDVEDCAVLHVAALAQPDVQGERLLAFGERFGWNDILAIFRKEAPNRTFINDFDEIKDAGRVDNGRAEELLKRYGRGRFSTLEESMKKLIPWILEVEERQKEGKEYTKSTVENFAASLG